MDLMLSYSLQTLPEPYFFAGVPTQFELVSEIIFSLESDKWFFQVVLAGIWSQQRKSAFVAVLPGSPSWDFAARLAVASSV